jgi:hypothetical protein
MLGRRRECFYSPVKGCEKDQMHKLFEKAGEQVEKRYNSNTANLEAGQQAQMRQVAGERRHPSCSFERKVCFRPIAVFLEVLLAFAGVSISAITRNSTGHNWTQLKFIANLQLMKRQR